MFFRLKKSGDRGYVQIVENKREGAAVRQTVIANLGRVDELAASGALASVFTSGAKLTDQVLLIGALDMTPKAVVVSQADRRAVAVRQDLGAARRLPPCWATCSRSARSSLRSSGPSSSPRCIGCLFPARTATALHGWRITIFPAPRGSSCITSIAPWPGSARN